MRNPQLILAIGRPTALMSLAGCTGEIRYPSYYVLNIPTNVSAVPRSAPILGSVAVREFDTPRFLRGGPIAYRESPEQLGYYEYHRWAVDPRRAVEEVDQDSNVSIEVALSARLISLRTGEVLWEGVASKKAKLDQRSVPGIIAEMSRDVEDAVRGLVSSMQDRVSVASLSLTRSKIEQ